MLITPPLRYLGSLQLFEWFVANADFLLQIILACITCTLNWCVSQCSLEANETKTVLCIFNYLRNTWKIQDIFKVLFLLGLVHYSIYIDSKSFIMIHHVSVFISISYFFHNGSFHNGSFRNGSFYLHERWEWNLLWSQKSVELLCWNMSGNYRRRNAYNLKICSLIKKVPLVLWHYFRLLNVP